MSFNYKEIKENEAPEARPKTNWAKALAPLLGLVLVAAAGAVAWVLSAPAYELIRTNIAGIPNTPELQIVAGIVIFLVVVLVYAMIYALFAPKPQQMVSENELDREKQQKLKEAQRAKRRKRDMRNKMKQRNR